jgi:uncharacterized protein involved in exopolysaccharide biosynthesis
MIEENYQHIDYTSVRDILTAVFKHKYKILVAFLVIFAAALAFASQVRETYEAKSVLLIKLGREFSNQSLAGGPAQPGNSTLPLDAVTKGEISILTGHDLSKKVVGALGPMTLYPELSTMTKGADLEGAAMAAFEKDLAVTTIGSSLVEIRFTNSNPKVVAQAVNMLVDAFKDRHLEVFGGKSTEFLESQKQVFEQKLKESENRLAGFKERNRIFSAQEQKTALINQRGTIDTSLKDVQGQIGELEQKVSLIRSQQWVIDTSPDVRTQLSNLRQKERDLLEKHTESSVVVQNVRGQIREVEESAKKDADGLRQRELVKTQGDLSIARAKAERLKARIAQIDGEISYLEKNNVQLQDLSRDVAQEEQNYQTYAKKLEESLISDDMDRRKMVAISVIEKAITPTAPKKIRFGKEEIVGAGFFGGIVGGIALALLIEFLAPGMTTPMSAQRRLDLPVLVAIALKE